MWTAAVAVAGSAAVSVRADQVVVGQDSHTHVRVSGFEGGLVSYRLANGQMRVAAIESIDLLLIDGTAGFEDFNEAERYRAQGEAMQSLVRYERARRAIRGFWVDLVDARFLSAANQAGALDKAVQAFVRVLDGRWSGPVAAARLMPDRIPSERDKRVVRALRGIDDATAALQDPASRALLQALRYEIYRHTRDRRTSEVGRTVAELAFPAEVRSVHLYEIQQHALADVLREDTGATAMDWLDRAIADCPDDALPGLLLLKGDTLLRAARTRNDLIRASWPFLRVAIHMPDDPHAPDGLLGAAIALERLEKSDKALALLDECLHHPQVQPAQRAQAEAVRDRLENKAR